MNKEPAQTQFETAIELNVAIIMIIDKRSVEASQSQYDRGVCVSAISAARHAVSRIEVKGQVSEYGQTVLTELRELHKTYNDPDGEYTSGKAPIGDIIYDVSCIVQD